MAKRAKWQELDLGSIRVIDAFIEKKITRTEEGHWIWLGYLYRKTHPMASVYLNGKPFTVHIRTYISGDGHTKRVTCGQERCVNPEHLEDVSEINKLQAEKAAHVAEIKEFIGATIRQLNKNGYSEGAIAKAFRMDISNVSRIVNNKIYVEKEG